MIGQGAEISSLIGRTSDRAIQLKNVINALNIAVHRNHKAADKQFSMTEQAAAAIVKMSASVKEVALNTASVANDSLSA